jgi:hypothetical protein
MAERRIVTSPMPEPMARLLDEYLAVQRTAGQAKLARKEAAIWEMQRQWWKPKELYRDWFFNKFGGSISAYEHRRALHVYADDVEPLWALVDTRRTSLTGAVHLLRRAKQLHRSGAASSMKKAVELAVQEWKDKRGTVAPPPPSEDAAKRSQRLMTSVTDLAKAYAAEFATEVETDIVEGLTTEFVAAMRIACDEFRRGLVREKRLQKEKVKVGLKSARHAAEVLAIHIPTRLKPEQIRVLRREVDRTKRQRLRQLHPDLTGKDTPEIRQEMESVLMAADLLKQYLAQQENRNGINS